MPRLRKPLRCPTCRKRMTQVGQTTEKGDPVYACPYCLTLKTRGTLKVPETPLWFGDAGRDPRRGRRSLREVDD